MPWQSKGCSTGWVGNPMCEQGDVLSQGLSSASIGIHIPFFVLGKALPKKALTGLRAISWDYI